MFFFLDVFFDILFSFGLYFYIFNIFYFLHRSLTSLIFKRIIYGFLSTSINFVFFLFFFTRYRGDYYYELIFSPVKAFVFDLLSEDKYFKLIDIITLFFDAFLQLFWWLIDLEGVLGGQFESILNLICLTFSAVYWALIFYYLTPPKTSKKKV